jgi:GTP cyclohydrolase IA
MDHEKIKKGVRLILEGIGEDPDRPGLADTPERMARMYSEIFAGLNSSSDNLLTLMAGECHDEMVLLKDIPFYSICEHHMLPFIGKASIAYIPHGAITGLSELIKALEHLAARPQVQERLTTQLADFIMEKLKPRGCMVVIEAEHLCISMRGAKKPGTLTTTSAVRGIFRSKRNTREEMLELLKKQD